MNTGDYRADRGGSAAERAGSTRPMRGIVITLVTAALALSGCGGDDQTATDSSPPTSTTQTTTEADDDRADDDRGGDDRDDGSGGRRRRELEDCLRDAGAKLASSPADLRFAAGLAIGGDVRTDISAERGNLRVYSLRPTGGDGWRIYVAAPRRAGDAPGISDLLGDPGAAVVTAYVNPADGRTIRKADACMTG